MTKTTGIYKALRISYTPVPLGCAKYNWFVMANAVTKVWLA